MSMLGERSVGEMMLIVFFIGLVVTVLGGFGIWLFDSIRASRTRIGNDRRAQFTAGHASGYTDGHAAGQAAAYTAGHSVGHGVGFLAGQTAVYDTAYQAGHTAGFIAAHNGGFTAGYHAGLAAAATAAAATPPVAPPANPATIPAATPPATPPVPAHPPVPAPPAPAVVAPAPAAVAPPAPAAGILPADPTRAADFEEWSWGTIGEFLAFVVVLFGCVMIVLATLPQGWWPLKTFEEHTGGDYKADAFVTVDLAKEKVKVHRLPPPPYLISVSGNDSLIQVHLKVEQEYPFSQFGWTKATLNKVDMQFLPKNPRYYLGSKPQNVYTKK